MCKCVCTWDIVQRSYTQRGVCLIVDTGQLFIAFTDPMGVFDHFPSAGSKRQPFLGAEEYGVSKFLFKITYGDTYTRSGYKKLIGSLLDGSGPIYFEQVT